MRESYLPARRTELQNYVYQTSNTTYGGHWDKGYGRGRHYPASKLKHNGQYLLMGHSSIEDAAAAVKKRLGGHVLGGSCSVPLLPAGRSSAADVEGRSVSVAKLPALNPQQYLTASPPSHMSVINEHSLSRSHPVLPHITRQPAQPPQYDTRRREGPAWNYFHQQCARFRESLIGVRGHKAASPPNILCCETDKNISPAAPSSAPSSPASSSSSSSSVLSRNSGVSLS